MSFGLGFALALAFTLAFCPALLAAADASPLRARKEVDGIAVRGLPRKFAIPAWAQAAP